MSAPKSKPKTQAAAQFDAARITRHIQMRGNPIKNLRPARLASMLDAFSLGNLRECAQLWAKMVERDDQLITVASKRKRGTPGRPYEIIKVDDSPAASKHKEALEAFYGNLSCTSGLDLNQRGGVRLLLKQMLSCIDFKYAGHEIIWKPLPGGLYTAEFKFIPLEFFENTTGRLRFLETDAAQYGTDLDAKFTEGGWMVTVGDGLMTAGSVAYMFKIMPLKAWVSYVEKYGIPGLHAETSAAMGSPEWNALADALRGYGEDLALITSLGAKITPLVAANAGNQPHPLLVERMDKAISRIWMGGDLATMSAGGAAVGANAQGGDLEDMKDEDIALLTDTLQESVDRWVIRYCFGDEVPLAYFQLQPPSRFDAGKEILVDQALVNLGVPVAVTDLQQRYNRPAPDAGEVLATKTTAPSPAINEAPAARAALFRADSIRLLTRAQAQAFQPLIKRMVAVADLPDAGFAAGLAALKADLPVIGKQILSSDTTGELAKAWESILGPALVSGAAEAARKQKLSVA